MGIVNGLSIVNNLIAGSMTGAQLQTYLATGANAASFVQVTNVRRQLQVLRNTPAAVTAVTASALASATIANNDAGVRQWPGGTALRPGLRKGRGVPNRR